jgi:hypothetical protein
VEELLATPANVGEPTTRRGFVELLATPINVGEPTTRRGLVEQVAKPVTLGELTTRRGFVEQVTEPVTTASAGAKTQDLLRGTEEAISKKYPGEAIGEAASENGALSSGRSKTEAVGVSRGLWNNNDVYMGPFVPPLHQSEADGGQDGENEDYWPQPRILSGGNRPTAFIITPATERGSPQDQTRSLVADPNKNINNLDAVETTQASVVRGQLETDNAAGQFTELNSSKKDEEARQPLGRGQEANQSFGIEEEAIPYPEEGVELIRSHGRGPEAILQPLRNDEEVRPSPKGGVEASRSLGRGEASRLNQFVTATSPILLEAPSLLHVNATQVQFWFYISSLLSFRKGFEIDSAWLKSLIKF